jgi:transposase
MVKDSVLYFSDEMRYGLMSNFRRSWSRVGARAILPQKQVFKNSYLYSAISPTTGDDFHLIGFTDMDTQTEEIFLKELKKKHPKKHVVVVIDNAPCHRPKVLHAIYGLTLIYLPSYSPELNPVERYFEELRRATANEVFKDMKDLEKRLTKTIKSLTKEKLKQLCGYDWILKQVGEVN